MKYTRKTKFKFFVLWSLLLISFCCISFYLIISASGYKVNWDRFTIEKTGILVIKSQPKDISISIDGRLVSKQTPYVQRDILPGRYDISLSKPLYQGWSKTISIESGNVTQFDSVVMLLSDPIVEQASTKEKIILDNFISDNDVVIQGNEIYIHPEQPQLVTRLSGEVLQAILFPDNMHVIYQIGDEIKLCDTSGQNVQNITTLPSKVKSSFQISNAGKVILIKQESSYLKLRIL